MPNDAINISILEAVGLGASDLNLTWVASECRKQLEAHDWICELKNGDLSVPRLRLIHRVTGEKRNTHEILDLYREVVSHIQSSTRVEPISLNDILGELASLDSSTDHDTLTKLLEYTFWNLGIDPSEEFYIVEPLLNYLLRHTGMHAVPICDTNLHTIVSRSRACFLRATNPNGISLCNRCSSVPSARFCFECGDFLCVACSNFLHAKGSRCGHAVTPFEQPTCSECSHQLANVWCTKCCDLFCDACYLKLHSTPTRSSHVMELPYTCACPFCIDQESAGYCEKCLTTLCHDCSAEHRKLNPNHQYIPSLRSTEITTLVALFQKTQWPTPSLRSARGIIHIDLPDKGSVWYDFVERKTYNEDPKIQHDHLQSTAAKSIIKRSKFS